MLSPDRLVPLNCEILPRADAPAQLVVSASLDDIQLLLKFMRQLPMENAPWKVVSVEILDEPNL